MEHSQRLEAGAARGAGFIKQTWYLPAAGHCQVSPLAYHMPYSPCTLAYTNPY